MKLLMLLAFGYASADCSTVLLSRGKISFHKSSRFVRSLAIFFDLREKYMVFGEGTSTVTGC